MTDDAGASSRRRFLRYGAGFGTAGLAGCTELLGTGEEGDASGNRSGTVGTPLAGETIKVGVLAPQPETTIARAYPNSARLAIDELNADGGLLGADVEMVLGNTKASGQAAKIAYNRLTEEEEVDLTVGIVAPRVLQSLLTPISQSQTLQFTCGAPSLLASQLVSRQTSVTDDSPEEEYRKYKYHFRVGPPNTSDLADAFVEFLGLYADDLGWDSAGLLVENFEPTKPFVELLQSQGSEHVDFAVTKQPPPSLTNWTPIYDELESEGVDVALVAQVLSGTAAVQQWADQQRNFEFGGISIPAQEPDFYRRLEGRPQYVFTMNTVTPQTENTQYTQPFMQAYNDAHDTYPIFAGPMVYDAVNIYAEAVRQAETTDAEELVPALEELTFERSTVMPSFSFRGPDEEFAHDPAWTCMSSRTCGEEATGIPVWQQWQEGDEEGAPGDGVMHAFAPEQNATAEYRKPDWIA